MTAKQILDAFSETLMQDERILSPRERDLMMSILQNSKLASSDPAIQSAVTAAITRSVGETVAHRAFALLGGSIVEQIVAQAVITPGTEDSLPTVVACPAPIPPGPQPPNAPGPGVVKKPGKEHPHPHDQPHAPRAPMSDPPGPQPPNSPLPPGPQGTRQIGTPVLRGGEQNHTDSRRGVGVMEAPEVTRAQCVVLDEFLAPQELDELVSYALEHQAEFQSSEVVAPAGEPGLVDYNHRRSQVLMDLGKHQEVILERIRGVLPGVLNQLGMEEFPIARVEAQITASNDGDFFHMHSDDGQEAVASRHLTFVYFFHREPRQFQGGELRLHDSRGKSQTGSYQTIVPQQNQIVFFPCSLMHEITEVKCLSQAFADSRFTLNGWLHN